MQRGYFNNRGPYFAWSLISYPLTARQFAYLKPALAEQVNRRVLAGGDEFYCLSTPQDWQDDVLPRLAGLQEEA